ncbi:MAG: hypothetical protein QM820_32360 [Minicystis sp.]
MQLPTFRAPDDARLLAMLAKAIAQPGDAPPTPAPASSTVVDRDACRRDMASALKWAARNRNTWRSFDAVGATKAAVATTPRKAEPPSAAPPTSSPASARQGGEPKKGERASPSATGRSVAAQERWVSPLFGQRLGKFTVGGNPILGSIMAAMNPTG